MIHISISKYCKVCGKDLTEHYDSFFSDSIHTLRRDCCSPLTEEEQEIVDADAAAWEISPRCNLETGEWSEPTEEFKKAYAHYYELYDAYVKKHRPMMNMSG